MASLITMLPGSSIRNRQPSLGRQHLTGHDSLNGFDATTCALFGGDQTPSRSSEFSNRRRVHHIHANPSLHLACDILHIGIDRRIEWTDRNAGRVRTVAEEAASKRIRTIISNAGLPDSR